MSSDPPATAALAKAVDALDKVSQCLARAGGMALTTGLTELVSLIGDAGCDLDDVINDLQELVDCPGCGDSCLRLTGRSGSVL